MPMPGGGDDVPPAVRLDARQARRPRQASCRRSPRPAGSQGAYGYRYWTISVPNLDEVTDRAQAAGCKVAIKPREIRPGVRISMIEDPDGNWVELLEVTPQS